MKRLKEQLYFHQLKQFRSGAHQLSRILVRPIYNAMQSLDTLKTYKAIKYEPTI